MNRFAGEDLKSFFFPPFFCTLRCLIEMQQYGPVRWFVMALEKGIIDCWFHTSQRGALQWLSSPCAVDFKPPVSAGCDAVGFWFVKEKKSFEQKKLSYFPLFLQWLPTCL